jgi:anti-sigma factor RsiW
MLIRRAYRTLAERPIGPRMLQSLMGHDTTGARRRWLWPAAALAAGILLFVAGATSGWFGRTLLAPMDARAHALVADAAAAHLVYAVEVRHPVEVPASEQDHLATWLGRRLQVPLRVPDLRESGYELVGGRLLPAEAGRPAATCGRPRATKELRSASPARAISRRCTGRMAKSPGCSSASCPVPDCSSSQIRSTPRSRIERRERRHLRSRPRLKRTAR